MSFFEDLELATADERHYLLSAPIIQDALDGRITRPQYAAFLTEAYFHVKQTVPLLMACGARLGDDREWLRQAVAQYIADEYGHEQWILSDIAHCGCDPDRARKGTPSAATELMVSYAFDTIQRVNPAGFFGMVYVLEGTSVALATQAANRIRIALDLPDEAFSYLLSHGDIDQEHIRFLEKLLERLGPADRGIVLHCARRFFYLYAQIFRTLPQASTELRQVA
ncbi:MAG: iron-containing redox enzyme family protein [Gammaproteobacteria bacterium]|nr:iron-containing redox enzyme family protein [Gammaproteobacteria bacterium]MDH4256088.1 iron-containing redox enzyme family protein [Gammaproteobacteria bacterium]MDH5311428.1 iron-containing redox enzyme family protein [Gammaproteobacteria bacterium]